MLGQRPRMGYRSEWLGGEMGEVVLGSLQSHGTQCDALAWGCHRWYSALLSSYQHGCGLRHLVLTSQTKAIEFSNFETGLGDNGSLDSQRSKARANR